MPSRRLIIRASHIVA
jgi:cytosine/adenosine deaminase-related metal-dependent hydrolase